TRDKQAESKGLEAVPAATERGPNQEWQRQKPAGEFGSGGAAQDQAKSHCQPPSRSRPQGSDWRRDDLREDDDRQDPERRQHPIVARIVAVPEQVWLQDPRTCGRYSRPATPSCRGEKEDHTRGKAKE